MPYDLAPSLILGIDTATMAASLAGIAVFAVIVALYAALTVRDPMLRRVKSLAARRHELRTGIVEPARRRASLVRRSKLTERMGETLSRLKVLQDSQLSAVQQRLAQAGIRRKDLAVAVIFARMVLPIVLGGGAALLIYGFDTFPAWGAMRRFMTFAVALGIGYKGPDFYVGRLVAQRTLAIRKGLPDALDLLVICAEAGLSIDAAFNWVARELGRVHAELGDEFALTAIELSFLTDRRHAFDNLAYRVDIEAVRGVVTTLIQTERYGTPLASSLRVLSAEFRHDRMMRAEEKAARLPAIMTIPLILFILPVLFIVIMGPAACSIADAFSGGSTTSH